jgi:ATP-dependent Lon protease
MIDGLNELLVEMPNLAAVIEEICNLLAISAKADSAIRLFPTLLVGDPGIGKTYFVERLASIFGVHSEVIDMSGITAGFIIAGNDPSWAEGKPGRVFNALMSSTYANPVVILDEVDKVSGDQRHDPLGPLYRLLEPSTAKGFQDEYFAGQIRFDASNILWFATANDSSSIPDPIKSRFNIFHVPTPTVSEKAVIAKGAFKNLVDQMGWNKAISGYLDDDSAFEISQGDNLRDIRMNLVRACGRAVRAGRDQVLVEDILINVGGKTRRIGF